MPPDPFSFAAVSELPAPADDHAAQIGFARWRDAAAGVEDSALARFMHDFAEDPTGRRLLMALFGNSPFLTGCCIKEPALLMRLAQHGPDSIFAEILRPLGRDGAPVSDRAALMSELRILKQRVALVVAIADIAALWSLDRITGALSAFAEAALDVAARHLLAGAAEAGDIADAESSGFIILGMGKLGARELNYSSDIDLILLYDTQRARYGGRQSVERFFTRLAGELVRLMAERTAEGYVFRTDLRLRPDPGSTPPAVSRAAALAYYESAGQNWERAALIKARPVAGDRAAGAAFLAELTPFLWRKHLDFAAIEDIHSIKRQIDSHGGGGRIAVAGHNVKLGRGGIREIEFFAQTQQLIWGGRMPELRCAGTCDALAALATVGRISIEAAAAMSEAYRFLRRVEHRLQMIDDAQIHTLPTAPAALRHVALFLGFDSIEDFTVALTHQLNTVENHYARLFETAPTLAAPGNLVFTGSENDPETLATLARLGFAEPAKVADIIRGWHHGRYRATRSQRARELLTELVPPMLAAFAASPDPDVAFLRFDQFLAHLPAGVQLFSLFYNNPPLLALMAEIMGAGPRIADAVARRPALLDGVLTAGFFDPPPPRSALVGELAALLGRARHYEEALGLVRRWVGDRKFQIGVQLLRHRLDGEAAGAAFADVAEAAIAALLPHVAAEFAQSHGRIAAGMLVVLGLGKLGSREMTVTSDLDLILLYDAPPDAESAGGPRPLAAAAYYGRLCQRFINALTALTADGSLYEVDMRLRPSGTTGPIASSLAAFRRYHDELAWTWEHMALTRARPIVGDESLAGTVMDVISGVLRRPRDPEKLRTDVADMRRRIAEEHRVPHEFDVKHRRGGMIDIEFIAQYLQLRVAARHPEALQQNTQQALRALAAAGALAANPAASLGAALALWRNLQSLVKLTVDEPLDEAAATPALKAILAAGTGMADFATLKSAMESAARRVLVLYDSLIESPEERAP